MDYLQLAQWTGWPPIVGGLVLLGFIGAFFFAQRDGARSAVIEALKEQMTRHDDTTPDILVSRLRQRREALEEELRQATEQDTQRQVEVDRLNRELDATRSEARLLDRQLQEAQRELFDLVLPRDGRVKQSLAFEILRYVDTQHAIFIPVRNGETMFGVADQEVVGSLSTEPGFVALRVYFPGMHHTYLRLTKRDRTLLGQVECPYPNTYDRDYFTTLLAILPYLLHEELPVEEEVRLGDHGDLSIALGFRDVSFQGYSPIDPTLGFFRFGFSGTADTIMNALMGRFAYQGEWYQGFNGSFEPVG